MNRWRLAFFGMTIFAAVMGAFYTYERARRIVAEEPCRIRNALVVLYPGGLLSLDTEGIGPNVQVVDVDDVFVYPRLIPGPEEQPGVAPQSWSKKRKF